MGIYAQHAMECIKAGKLGIAIAFLQLQLQVDAAYDKATDEQGHQHPEGTPAHTHGLPVITPRTAGCVRCGDPGHFEDNHDQARVSHAPTTCTALVEVGAGTDAFKLIPCGELIRWADGTGGRPSGWYHVNDQWLGDTNHDARPGVVAHPGRRD